MRMQQRPFVRLGRFLRGTPPGATLRHTPSTVTVVPVDTAVVTMIQRAAQLAQLEPANFDVGTLSTAAPEVAEVTSDLLATFSQFEATQGRCAGSGSILDWRQLTAHAHSG